MRREIGSIEPKKVFISEFFNLKENTVIALRESGIKNSKDYFEAYHNNQEDIIQKTGISQNAAQELLCLCDLVRINGVGAVAAKCFFDAGYTSVEEIANATAEEMLIEVTKINEDKHYYNAKLGTKDMQFCIDYAKLLMDLGNSN